MKISKYAMFIKILEAGSFSKSAEKYNYTQSSISQMIKSLEAELDTPLLHRSKRGLVLTAEGERLLPFFLEISNAEQHLHDATARDATLTGTIRIGAPPSVSCYLLPQVIKSFSAKYPQVRYQLNHANYREVDEAIVSGNVDLGFIRYPTDLQLDCIPFQPEQLLLTLSASNHLAKNAVCPVTQLNDEPFILLDDGYTEWVLHYFEENNVHPVIMQKVKGNLALYGFINYDLGFSIMPEPALRLAPPSIIGRPLSPPLTRTIAVACKDRSRLSLVNRLFWKEITTIGDQLLGLK